MVSTVRGPALILLGRQGSGKSTQAGRLARHLGLVHVSTGELLRDAVATSSPLGQRVAQDMEAGHLVADDVVLGVVAERLREPEVGRSGFALDGFPRTADQLADLRRLVGTDGLDAAVLLDVPLDEVRRRLDSRRVCQRCGATVMALDDEDVVPCPVCGGEAVRRPDDTPAAIEQRLAAFEAESQPLLAALRDAGLLVTVDAVGSEDQVFERLLTALRPVVWGTDEAVS